jgi:hypothetical protein
MWSLLLSHSSPSSLQALICMRKMMAKNDREGVHRRRGSVLANIENPE